MAGLREEERASSEITGAKCGACTQALLAGDTHKSYPKVLYLSHSKRMSEQYLKEPSLNLSEGCQVK